MWQTHCTVLVWVWVAVVAMVATGAVASNPVRLPQETNIPCYTEARDMFMWTDFQCHAIAECSGVAGLSGVDVGRMVEYNEVNWLSPAQPCRCVASEPGRRIAVTGEHVLPDNCGMCGGFVPLGERPAALATQEFAQDARCVTVSRGDLESEGSPDMARADGYDVPRQTDFFCQAASAECRAQRPSRTVDSLWLGAHEFDAESVDAPHYLAGFYGYSHNMATASEGPFPFEQCGPFVDLAATLADARCRCVPNAGPESTSWYPLSFAWWMDVAGGDPQQTMCKRCMDGYEAVDHDGVLACHKQRMQCAGVHPDHPMLLTSAPAAGTGIVTYRCVDPDEVCSRGAPPGYTLHMADASTTENRCVCTNEYHGRAWTNPEDPALGPHTVCSLCNNEAGYFAVGYSNPCQFSLQHWSNSPAGLDSRAVQLSSGRLALIKNNVFGAWDTDRWPDGLVWDDVDLHELYAPYPIAGTEWAYGLPSTVPGTSEGRREWLRDILRNVLHPDATDADKALFTWWMCGQAAAPQVPGQPLACRCVNHANQRLVVPGPDPDGTVLASPTYRLVDDCFCDDGYVFDRTAHAGEALPLASTGACVPHADVCGAAAITNITHMCVCWPGVTKDEHGRCTVCAQGRFRPLDGCPAIDVWCNLPSSSLVAVDVDATTATGQCTCDEAHGLLPYAAQRDGVAGCHSCAQHGTVPNAQGVCTTTSAVCPDPTGRLDTSTTEATGVCTCSRGWVYAGTGEGCTGMPPDHWVDTTHDEVKPWSACGIGVDRPATNTAGACVCREYDSWEPFTPQGLCSTCESGYILVNNTCSTAVQACGTGVDPDQTHAAALCVCKSTFLPFDEQPTGACEDCKPLHTRRAVDPAECAPPTTQDMLYGDTQLTLQQYGTLMDMAFEDGASAYNSQASLDCAATWTEQTDVWVPHYRLQMPSVGTAILKTTTHNLDEAKNGCYAYFPCTGFVAFELVEQSGIVVYQLVYITTFVSFATEDRSLVYTPNMDLYSPSAYAHTWELQRVSTAQCPDPFVDPAWYWSMWHDRAKGAGIPFVGAGTLTSVRDILDNPTLAIHHFVWQGHLARLWPNPLCRMGPVAADGLTGCRAQTCPVYSSCPFTHPVGGTAAEGYECFLPGTQVSLATLDDAWGNSTWATTPAGDHPGSCGFGACMYHVQANTAACACPTTGFANPDGHACDTEPNRVLDEGSGVCRYPLATLLDVQLCGDTDDACPPGQFGPSCALFDVDGFCHAPGDTVMCSGHGQCLPLAVPHDPLCACQDGWAGRHCSLQTCDEGCGPNGKCVAVTDNTGTVVSSACMCAIHETLGMPLAMKGPTGQCDVDLCNDHLGADERRHGSLVLHVDGATAMDGSPLGACVCMPNTAGLVNGGPLCDQPSCVNACGLEGGRNNVAYSSLCLPCSDVQALGEFAECDAAVPGIGAVCDCEGVYNSYWKVLPWRFDAECKPWCGDHGSWDVRSQSCACTTTAWKGDRCHLESCPNGLYSPDLDRCVSCNARFRLVDGHCDACAAGYEGDKCLQCSPAYIRSGTDDAPVCEPCSHAISRVCFDQSTASGECLPDHTVACHCRDGYEGPRCEACASGTHWRVVPGDVVTNTTQWPPGACAPFHAWAGCHPDHTNSSRLEGGRPICQCIEPYDVAFGCALCHEGYVQDPTTGACVPCLEALACDPDGTTHAECPNPGALLQSMDNGMDNRCVCDVARGRTGARCHECSVDTAWVPVPNSRPLACFHCDLECGPNGQVVCGVSTSRCACTGGWAGRLCDRCTQCGVGGTCLTVTNDHDPWCVCRDDAGYAKDSAMVGTPTEYRAPCTSCLPGFYMHGTRCLNIVEACGPGADAEATRAAGVCVCAADYLPMEQQLGATCETCVAGGTGPCGTCTPACGDHATCTRDEATGQFGCACDQGWAEHQGQCAVCAAGFHGPQCQPCPHECSNGQVPGTCTWNHAAATLECVCPTGSTHTRWGALGSGCRACVAGQEQGSTCAPAITCPVNAEQAVDDTSGANTCVCSPGYVRAFEEGHPLLTPCVPPSVVHDKANPPEPDRGVPLLQQFDLATLSFVTTLVGSFFLCVVCVFTVALRCMRRAPATTQRARAHYRAVPTTPTTTPPRPATPAQQSFGMLTSRHRGRRKGMRARYW